MTPTAWIFVNGELLQPTRLAALLRQEDLLIAADGGAQHLLRMGLQPALLIGDLDSLEEHEVNALQAAGTEVRRYPADKDWTDLELALRHAVEQGWHRIRLAAALGGRLDQTLGNILLLCEPAYAGLDLALDDGQEEVLLVQADLRLEGKPGDLVSLLPLDPSVDGVSTQGLRWRLNDETLWRHYSRGMSNEMLGETASVSVRRGALLCVHTRKE